jgi:hypothetical protein
VVRHIPWVSLVFVTVSGIVPVERSTLRAQHVVVVPTTQGRDCVDLDSRWGVGAILSWKQSICGSNEAPAWVQTDCSQDFARSGYWLATSTDGKDFSRKARYDVDQSASSIAQFVCFSVGR